MENGWNYSGLVLLAGVIAYLLYRSASYLLAPYTEHGTREESGVKSSDFPWLWLFLGGAYLLTMHHFATGWLFFAACVFASVLIWLSYLDIKQFVLPDFLTLPLLALGLGQAAVPLLIDWKESLLGAVFGFGSLWLVATTYRLVRKREGMGRGDFKLLAALGAWVGVWQLPLVIFLSAVLGILIGVLRKVLLGHSLNTPFPFGPALCLAGYISLLYGNAILSWYLELLG